MLGQAIPRAEHHVLAVVKLVGRLEFLSRDSDFCEWHSPIQRSDPPALGVFNSKWVGMAASPEMTILAVGNLPSRPSRII